MPNRGNSYTERVWEGSEEPGKKDLKDRKKKLTKKAKSNML